MSNFRQGGNVHVDGGKSHGGKRPRGKSQWGKSHGGIGHQWGNKSRGESDMGEKARNRSSWLWSECSKTESSTNRLGLMLYCVNFKPGRILYPVGVEISAFIL